MVRGHRGEGWSIQSRELTTGLENVTATLSGAEMDNFSPSLLFSGLLAHFPTGLPGKPTGIWTVRRRQRRVRCSHAVCTSYRWLTVCDTFVLHFFYAAFPPPLAAD